MCPCLPVMVVDVQAFDCPAVVREDVGIEGQLVLVLEELVPIEVIIGLVVPHPTRACPREVYQVSPPGHALTDSGERGFRYTVDVAELVNEREHDITEVHVFREGIVVLHVTDRLDVLARLMVAEPEFHRTVDS